MCGTQRVQGSRITGLEDFGRLGFTRTHKTCRILPYWALLHGFYMFLRSGEGVRFQRLGLRASCIGFRDWGQGSGLSV